jgi:putative acetyltransferase
MSLIKIYRAELTDLKALQELFVETISSVCSADYDSDQIAAWTSSVEDSERWLNILTKQVVVVAKISEQIVGFATLANGNYIDLLYVHKDHQGKGIAGTLYKHLEHVARQNDQSDLSADVSKTALPFFQHMGFTIEREQTVVRRGVELVNFRMRKLL